MLKRAGLDQVIVDGRADRPVRLLVTDRRLEIVDAEDDLFESVGGNRVVRQASTVTDSLTARYPGSSTVATGPAGWNGVAFACLTSDRHHNFGRGGAGAVFGSKNLVAITAHGRRRSAPFDHETFDRRSREIDAMVRARVNDPAETASFRPRTGTTWWLDRAFDGRFGGAAGGYLPWRNFDEGHFDEAAYAGVDTEAFEAIAGRHRLCNRCRHIACARAAAVGDGPYAGEGVRPEFETIALWINCCITDRDAIFHMNRLSNELGLDTMTLGSVAAATMELTERGLLPGHPAAPRFGSAEDMLRLLQAIAYQSDDLGRLLGRASDEAIAEIAAGCQRADVPAVAAAVTTAFGGLGFAGIVPKVFPGMYAAYATSNRGRGDHTHAWTVQAEEVGGLAGAPAIGAALAAAQSSKAMVDSLGVCDFFPEDLLSDVFLDWYRALTGDAHDADTFERCGRRIYTTERLVNTMQGRGLAYDTYVPPKMIVPLTCGPHAGKAVDARLHREIVDAWYRQHGWADDGTVPAARLQELGIAT
jgi:aldehyde:ferredoxin oxidoreductase